jgi:hypothetical protein
MTLSVHTGDDRSLRIDAQPTAMAQFCAAIVGFFITPVRGMTKGRRGVADTVAMCE